VRVNALCQAFVYTDLTRAVTDDPEHRRFLEERHPMGRLAQPEEIARAALFLASAATPPSKTLPGSGPGVGQRRANFCARLPVSTSVV